MEEELKQVILVRTDLKMSCGKTSAQVAHASVDAVLKSDKKIVNKWLNQGMKKVVLKVNGEKELIKYFLEAKSLNLQSSLIEDAGRTELKPNTKTTVAIGPDFSKKIDNLTKDLKPF